MNRVYVCHPLNPNRPFEAMVASHEDAVSRFGSQAEIRKMDESAALDIASAERRSDIQADHNSGNFTCRELMNKYGIGEAEVYRILAMKHTQVQDIHLPA